jgi:hypothetical protein
MYTQLLSHFYSSTNMLTSKISYGNYWNNLWLLASSFLPFSFQTTTTTTNATNSPYLNLDTSSCFQLWVSTSNLNLVSKNTLMNFISWISHSKLAKETYLMILKDGELLLWLIRGRQINSWSLFLAYLTLEISLEACATWFHEELLKNGG